MSAGIRILSISRINSMKTYGFYKLLLTVVAAATLVNITVFGQNATPEGNPLPTRALVIENFDYPAGSAITANGWDTYSGTGTNPMTVTTPGLTYSGYAASGIGNA